VRVACVGGGPAGLFLALLLRRAGDHLVDVFDRNPPDATYGFGVVFSRLSLARLRSLAPDVVGAALDQGVRWDGVHVRLGAGSAASTGHGYAAVERRAMLRVLREHAERAGARVHHGCAADAWDLAGRYDVVVAADGAGSRTRDAHSDRFGATVEWGPTRYAWFGADRPAAAMTFLFAAGPHGPLAAHVYPYSPTASTFLVEVPEATFLAAGMDDGNRHPPGWTDEAALAYCQEVFGPQLRGELAGARLVGNGSRWLRFPQVAAARWSSGRVVLAGDAAHTAHFSVGSGTTMALEDAAELARRLAGCAGDRDLPGALAAYQSTRQPAVWGLQRAAWASRQLWEHPPGDGAAGLLLFRLLTRTGQATTDLLLRTDRALPAAVGRPLSDEPGAPPPLAVEPATASTPDGADGHVLVAGPGDVEAVTARAAARPAAVVLRLADDADGDEPLAAGLRRLRAALPGARVGVCVAVPDTRDGTADPPVPGLVARVGRLHRREPVDVVAVGRGEGTAAGLRVTQLVACDLVRTRLGLATAYLCPPGDVRHGWTHVQAGRADEVWVTAPATPGGTASGPGSGGT
jgi:2-polyprenyl-6-methoxyphenol hydroxylase-like FAD-dependent oxidoreductase